jgi:hypothetical protein
MGPMSSLPPCPASHRRSSSEDYPARWTIQRFERRFILWIRQRRLQLGEQHGPKLRIRFQQPNDRSPELSFLGP